MKIKTIFITIVLMLAGRLSAEITEHKITVNNLTRKFYVYTPADLPQTNRPLVIALHGGGTNGKSMERYSELDTKADAGKFIVVYPDGTGRLARLLTWNAGSCCGYAKRKNIDDVMFIKQMIEFLIDKYKIDRARVYVTGISNGAMMAYRLVAEIPEYIAAVAAVSGTLEVPAKEVKSPMPILHFHGTEDKYVPWHGGRGERTGKGMSFNSVDATINTWVAVDKAKTPAEVINLPDIKEDGTKVVEHIYAATDGKNEVILYEIVGGGHAWPGKTKSERILGKATENINANDIMWKFFKKHSRQQ
jgi:polyhydroxybutyrate depolymerase